MGTFIPNGADVEAGLPGRLGCPKSGHGCPGRHHG